MLVPDARRERALQLPNSHSEVPPEPQALGPALGLSEGKPPGPELGEEIRDVVRCDHAFTYRHTSSRFPPSPSCLRLARPTESSDVRCLPSPYRPICHLPIPPRPSKAQPRDSLFLAPLATHFSQSQFGSSLVPPLTSSGRRSSSDARSRNLPNLASLSHTFRCAFRHTRPHRIGGRRPFHIDSARALTCIASLSKVGLHCHIFPDPTSTTLAVLMYTSLAPPTRACTSTHSGLSNDSQPHGSQTLIQRNFHCVRRCSVQRQVPAGAIFHGIRRELAQSGAEEIGPRQLLRLNIECASLHASAVPST